jgi:hypothetical protein
MMSQWRENLGKIEILGGQNSLPPIKSQTAGFGGEILMHSSCIQVHGTTVITLAVSLL